MYCSIIGVTRAGVGGGRLRRMRRAASGEIHCAAATLTAWLHGGFHVAAAATQQALANTPLREAFAMTVLLELP